MKRILSALLTVSMMISSSPALAEEKQAADNTVIAAETVTAPEDHQDEITQQDSAQAGEKAGEQPSDGNINTRDNGKEEPADDAQKEESGSPALFGVAVVDTLEQLQEPALTEQTIEVALYTDSDTAHLSNEPVIPTKNMMKGTKSTLAAPQKADGNAADGNAADGKAPDGKADDGETTISITGELPEGAYAIGWPVDIGEVVTDQPDEGLTREAEVLGAYQLELYNADGTKIENMDKPVTVSLNLAPKATKSRSQTSDQVEIVPLSKDGSVNTKSPMKAQSSGSTVTYTTKVLSGIALLLQWYHISNHMTIYFTAADGLSTADWLDAGVLIESQRMWYTSVICPEGQDALEALAMRNRDPRIEANIIITALPEEGTWDLYGIIDSEGHLSEKAIREDVKAGDLIPAIPADVYGYALVGDGKVSEQTLTTEDPDGTYRVTVTYNSRTGIPMRGTRLEIVEIDRESDQYETCYALASEALNGMEEGRLFEIRIVDEETGDVWQPDEGTLVDVLVELLKCNYRAGSKADIVHLKDDNTAEVLDVDVTRGGDDYAYSFRTGSFSPFMVSYTVDFYYNGYKLSIPGGSGIMLEQLFAELDIKVSVTDVVNVVFTDPNLISVEKEEDDWRLTSLAPFDTEEKLTIKLNDGSEIRIDVLDAQDAGTTAPEAESHFMVQRTDSTAANQQASRRWFRTLGGALTYINNTLNNTARIEVLSDYTISNDDIIGITRTQSLTIESTSGSNFVLTRGVGVTGDLIAKRTTTSLAINNLTFNNGTGTDAIIARGGANNNATLTLNNVTLNGQTGTGYLIYGDSGSAKFELNNCTLNGSTNSSAKSIIFRYHNNNMGETVLNSTTINGGNTEADLIYLRGNTDKRQCTVTMTDCTVCSQNSKGSILKKIGTNPTTITGGTFTGPTGDSDAALIDVVSSNDVTIGSTAKPVTIYRGQTRGPAIANSGTCALLITNSTISGAKGATDSASVSATSPLIQQGAGALTLTDVTVENHVASNAGVCAVDASACSAVNIGNNTAISGNTANGSHANLKISGTAINIPNNATFSGNVGVYSMNTYSNGQKFGAKGNTAAQYTGTFSNDRDEALKAALSGNNLYWTWSDISNCSFYITGTHSVLGANTTLYFLTLDEAIAAANSFTLPDPVVIYGMAEESTMKSAATTPKAIIIQPGRDGNGQMLRHITVKRGNVQGDMIESDYAITLNNVTLDGESKTVSGALLKMTANATLTLNNTVVQNHIASAEGVCAVDATAATSLTNVKVSGSTAITGNTAGGKAANLNVNGTNVLNISDNLTGTVGVTTERGEGQQFATRAANKTGYNNFINDKDSDLISVLEVNNILWQARPGALMSFTVNNKEYKTLQGAFNAAPANSVIKGLVESYTFNYTESCNNNAVTVQPGDNFDWMTLKRGDVSGDMITSSKNLTLKNMVLDGQNINASGSLLKMTAGNLSLNDVTVRNHKATGMGGCAVDAEMASSVLLNGATSISGNTAAGKAANLRIPSDPTKTKIGALTEIVGITTANNKGGQHFADKQSSNVDASALYNLYNDANRLLRAAEGDNNSIYWSLAQKLPSSRFYIKGNLSFINDVTLYYDNLEEAVDISTEFSGPATIYSMVSEYTMKEPVVFSHDVTLKPGLDASGNQVSRLTLRRGEELGTIITHNKDNLILQNVTLDGENNTSVTGPLLRSSGGAGNITLDSVTVCNHTAAVDGVCAIDVSDSLKKILLKGDTNITGNTSGESPANLCVVGTNRLTVSGNLTGNIGVTNRLHELPGDQFGVKDQSSYTIGTFTNDLRENTNGTSSGTTLVWQGSTATSGNVVKLTDGNGNVLKRKTGNRYVDAVYTSVNGANSAVSDVNSASMNLYNADHSAYTGTVFFEFLQDRVEIINPGVQITQKRNLVFRTASKTATDGYPFEGTGSRTKIVFMNGGAGGNTDKRFIFTGDGSEIRFENIIVDGRADQGIQADQGSLVSVGDRASEHDIQVTIGNGAVFQNGASNTNDQGGGFYVGNGCELYMEPGSIIQYCKSNDGGDASGGAIYLAMGELFCNGGIIRNCVCSQGGAIDCGGTTDGSVSDKARVYFSGSPQIINNYDNSGNPMNFHLNYNSNNIITVVGDLDPDTRIGISADGDAAAEHSKEGQPFGTLANGVVAENLSSFVNDKDPRLTGAPGVGSGNERLVVWFYQMAAYATDDYMIDGDLIRMTEIDSSEGSYEPATLPQEYTVEEMEEIYHDKYPYISYKTADFTGISLSAYHEGTGISAGITNIRYTTYLQGRRWEYSMDDGLHWFGINGREFVFHYVRETRDNIQLLKKEDTSTADMLSGAVFKLERSFPTADSYSLYKNGAGKGKTKANGDEVKDTSINGIYTTGAAGEFIMNLPEGYYRLTETQAPEGYTVLSDPITFHVGVNAIPDTPENEKKSPYSVGSVSQNADYAGNNYNTWNTDKIFGTMTVGDIRKVPLHVLVQKGEDEYELDDTKRTTEYVTAALNAAAVTTINNALNPAPSGYVNYHIYYGKEDPAGTFTLETEQDVTSLKGTANGIIVNNDPTRVLTGDQAVYFIVYPEPRKVPYHILLNENGTMTDKTSVWATAGTNRTTEYFSVNATDGVNVLNAYGETKTDNGKTYRRAKVVYASSQATAMNGTELVWLVNTPEAAAARETSNASTNIGLLSSSDAVYIIYSSGYSLTVRKQVTGAMGDQTKDFTVYVTSNALTDASYKDDAATPNTYPVETVDGKKRIALTLHHGQSITLKDLPQGEYTISEAATGESYTTTYRLKAGSGTETDSNGTFTLSDDSEITVINHLDAISPTGISFTYAPYILMLLCGAALLLVRKKRRA